ncbi:nuclease harbi1-like protein [Plakobranchus ocellatus]|uniref:Nuclease harbi1-like protein n=1 Tax=Plakobranchus ocellatus TaxID=259542 RepID=A0AAV4DB79_9GAST|nr:nuclease harbi1-like protein [Plakobranchus ocellatus]
MGLPDTAPLPDSSASIPYFMIRGTAYPSKPYLITVFSGALTQQQQIYNYRHSRAKRCIECAFGVLAAKWRVLKTVIATDLETTENIVFASVVLHNIVLTLEADNTSQKDTEMWEDNQERRLEQAGGAVHRGRPSQYGPWIREKLVTYFNGPGALPWQDSYS